MSVATAQAAIVTATTALVLPGFRARLHFTDGKAPLEKRVDDALAAELRAQTMAQDSGIASAGIAQRSAVWDLCVLYPCPPTTDRRALELLIQQHMDAISDVLILPTAWIPHLDVCEPGVPVIDPVSGVGGETVALVARLPLFVLYS